MQNNLGIDSVHLKFIVAGVLFTLLFDLEICVCWLQEHFGELSQDWLTLRGTTPETEIAVNIFQK